MIRIRAARCQCDPQADRATHPTLHFEEPFYWQNPEGGDYDLVVLAGGPVGRVASPVAAAGTRRVAITRSPAGVLEVPRSEAGTA
jgi:hypothetical protein